MNKPPPWLLFGASAIVLAFAVVHVVQRIGQTSVMQSVEADQQQRVQRETAERKAELERDRAGIVARIEALQKAGDHGGAMQLAGRYYLLQDPELRGLFRQSAEIEARRQRLAETRRLLTTACTDERAWSEALEALKDLGAAPSALRKQDLLLTRLRSADVMPMIIAQLRGDPGSMILRQEDPNAPGHHEHHIQVHPDYAIGLRSEPPDESLLCAWRVAPKAPAGNAQRGLELVFWLAPEASGKDVRLEALRYVPPPSARASRNVSTAR